MNMISKLKLIIKQRPRSVLRIGLILVDTQTVFL